MQQKIKRAQIRKLKSLDITMADAAKVLLDATRGDFTNEDGIELIAQRN